MTINQLTDALYSAARFLRWFKAGKKSAEQRSLKPIAQRVGRVILLREAGKLSNRLFR